jgi:long-chain fatty acid transport protein
MRRISLWAQALFGLLALTAASPAAHATNGMYLVGYGAEVIGRAGANIGIADRSLAVNFNPAGISQLQGRHFTINLAVLAPSLTFENMTNPTTDGESNYFPLPSFAYVRGAKGSPWTWGLGFVAQGGMGAEFKNLNTFFGTRDEIFSEVRFATLVPTVAYSFNDDMAIGASVNIGWGDVAFKFFPNTSFFNTMMPEMSFFGMDMDPAGGLQTNFRLGYWWRMHPRVSLGLTYQTETDSNFEDGDLVVNFEGQPMLRQKVKYSADVDGFNFAAQAGIGLGIRATDKLIIALDVKQYYWDDAIDTITVTGTNPSVQGAPPELQIPFVFNWEDQLVVALGFDYRASDRWTVRWGYNHGENPVPDETMNPLFPATVEDHLTFGLGYLTGNMVWDFAIERAFENETTNDNTNPMINPFGPGSTVAHDQWTVAIGVSWALDRK